MAEFMVALNPNGGINSVRDFALYIGKSYAWTKGLLNIEELLQYEMHIDLPAVISSFGIYEYSIKI